MGMGLLLPRLYTIVDAQVLAGRGVALKDVARELRATGVGLMQYRDKAGSPQEVLRAAAVLREAMFGSDCRLIMNDRADLAVLAGFDGVHVGQGDLEPEDAKARDGRRGELGCAREGNPPFLRRRERMGHPDFRSGHRWSFYAY